MEESHASFLSLKKTTRSTEESCFIKRSPERLVPIGYEFTPEDLKEAGKLVLDRGRESNIEIKLPFKEERVSIHLNKEFHDKILKMASSLQVLIQLSITRVFIIFLTF